MASSVLLSSNHFKLLDNNNACILNVIMIALIALMTLMKPVSPTITSQCPDLSSFPDCNCHITTYTDRFHFVFSGNYLTIACGDSTGSKKGAMTDANVTSIMNLINATTPMEGLGIYYQNLTKVPTGLSKFTNLKAVSLIGNAITSVDATDLTWPGLLEINLLKNAITSLSGSFNLTNLQSDGSGIVYMDLSNNLITSISPATFTLSANYITLLLKSNSITSVSGDEFIFTATQTIKLDVTYNSLTFVKGDFKFSATDANNGNVKIYFDNNQLTTLSPATFYLNAPSYVWLSFTYNSLTSITADRITLKGTQSITLDLSFNQLTSVKLAPDTNPSLLIGQTLNLNNNNLTGTIDCNDLSINSGVKSFTLQIFANQISGAKCGASTPLDTANYVIMDWSYNSFTTLPAGAFAFAGKLNTLILSDQNTAFTSIEPGSLPTNFAPFQNPIYNYISLSNNKLSQLSQTTFQPIIQAIIDGGFAPSQTILFVSGNPFDCDINQGCGSEKWILTNPTYLPYLRDSGRCGDSAKSKFTSFKESNCKCPDGPPSQLSPCSCKPTTGSNTTISVSCANGQLNDTAMDKIISLFQVTTPIDTLDLSGNLLTAIPSGLANFNQLSSLSMSANGIVSFGQGQLNLPATVTKFDLSKNLLTAIPANLTQFNQLTNLNLAANAITAIESGQLNLPAAVQSLDLSFNRMTKVPSGLTQLAGVTSLSLASNGITSIGSGELNLTATVVLLDVSNNSISSIASSALPEKYANGSTINLSKNQLTILDQGVFQSILQSFVTGNLYSTTTFINVASNPLDCGAKIGCISETWIILDASLNAYIKNAKCSDATPFSSLTALNCKCPKTSIAPCECEPTAGSNTTLTIACSNLSFNDTTMKTAIDNVPSTTPVDTFDLSGNQLTAVPPGLMQFNQLSSLNLSNNSITAIESGKLNLPGNVKSLDFSQNQLTAIPSGLNWLSKLENLKLSANAISAIGQLNLPATVKSLDLSTNQLTKIPTNLTPLTSVTTLSLASNGITSIESGELNLTATVVSLDVSNNSISSIAPGALPVNYATGSTINLSSNKLTKLDQGVFQSILQSFATGSFNKATTFIDASSNANLDCGLPSGEQCGSEQWLFSNANLLPFVKGTCQNGKAFSSYSNEVCLCPPAADLNTCTCALTKGSNTTVTINCAGKNLTDSAVATLIDKIKWAAIDTIDLSGNLLTKVPTNLTQLASVTTLSLASNGITSIGSGELNLKATVVSLDVRNNLISTIASNALPVNYATGSKINLSSNKLTKLDQGIFQSILQTFATSSFNSATTFIDFSSNLNLDCGLPSGEQCGSEQWIFSNATLLPFVKGTCQNGKAFSSYSNEVCLCPPAADLGTCTCALTKGSSITVTIDCTGKNLTDSAVETLVDKIKWAAIDTIDLSRNLLTKVPTNLVQQIVNVTTLSLASNGITSIGLGELNLKATVVSLDVSNNSISTVASGALPVNYANGSRINLSSNKLTKLDQGVFQSILQSFATGGFNSATTFIDASSNANLDCGLPSGEQCGSEQWLFTNANLLPFVKGTCQNGNEFSSYSNEVCLCPPAADLGTCTCALTTGGTNTTVTIDCTGKNLTDSAVETLVGKIPWAAIDTLILDGNKMTKIPPGLSGLTQLSSLSAASNSITAINASDLSSLLAAIKKLNFASNSISTIAAGSFPDKFASGTQIILDDNPLTSLTQGAFEPVLKYFIASGYSNSDTFISLANTNQFDCVSNACGSEKWLVTTNSQYKGFVQGAPKCSDGTALSNLTALICSCPTFTSEIAPCRCQPTAGSNATLSISCASQKVDDTGMNAIIATVSTITAPIDTIDLSGNLLTKVPTNLAQQFVNVTTLSLASNGITSIGSGELSLKATVVSLDVSNNSISTVASGALPVNYATGSVVNLSNNKLTSLEQNVFQSILQSFATGSFNTATTFIDVASNPFDCASKIGCGSEGWIIPDASLNVYIKNATCGDTTPFSSLTDLNCKCPVAPIAPCSCQPTAGSDSTLTISCVNQNLTDVEMKAIIDNVPSTTPVDTFDLSGNQITAVPSGLTQFNKLTNLNLSKNAITAVETGQLKFSAAVKSLDLSSNQISAIAASSLPVNYASGASLNLNSNLLTSLDQSVFEPIIRGFITNGQTGNTISIADNKFDCGLDAGCGSEKWFVLSSTALSPYVTGGTCQDATLFSALTAEICTCPPAKDIGPCTCAFISPTSTNLKFNCSGQSLDDVTMKAKLAKIPADSYSVQSMDLSGNKLTSVPSEVASYSLLDTVSLASNQIGALVSGDLSLKAAVISLDVSFNQISSIATDSLPTNYVATSTINLGHNKLTKLDQNVFRPIVQSFLSGNYDSTATFIDVDSNPFDCASKIGCGSEGWIIPDASLNVYIKNATCSDTTPFSSLTALNCKCPVASISPCSCQPTAGSESTLTISCANQNLTDAKMKAIIGNVPSTTPVDTFDLSGNQLTAVPGGLTQFNELTNLNLSTNAITAVETGQLKLSVAVKSLDLSSNQISTIAASSLPVNYTTDASINLDSNLLTSLDQTVFEPIIRSFITNGQTGNSISIANNKFDCGLDAGCGSEKWFVLDSTALSPYVTGAVCGDTPSTPFADLTAEICACPPAVDISPCTCAFSSSAATNLVISCSDQSLDDATTASKLEKCPASFYPVDTFDLSGNSLTVVPSGLADYPLLVNLSLANNQITSVKNGQLTLPATVVLLDLSSNAIDAIDADSLPATYSDGASLKLDSNQLTSFSEIVFKPIVDYFIGKSFTTNSISVASNPFACGVSVGCSDQAWLVLSPDYLSFVSGGTCQDSTAFIDLTTTICLCPPSISIATCSCDLTAYSSTTVAVNCTSQGLGNAVMASVLLNISVTTPLDTLLLGGNNLTKVPSSSSAAVTRATSTSLLTRFPSLNSVSLSSNAITSILKGDLTLTAPLKFLDLSSNRISQVAVGSLPASYAKGVQILLNSNKLTGLNAAVFQPILDYFVKNGFPANSSFISVSNNPINCNTGTVASSSVCYANVGWLISSKSIAPYVQNGTCADGTSISAVNTASCSQTPTTQTPSTTTKRPKKKKPMAVFAISWVNSVLNHIFNNH